jgi:dienelactone hydrolase
MSEEAPVDIARGLSGEGRLVQLPVAGVVLEGSLGIPAGAHGAVVFAHGSGSSRHSPRNRQVAWTLREAGLATLLFDLLTAAEETIDVKTRALRFDVELLAERLVAASDWLAAQPETAGLRLGYFGASTGGAAALLAAAERPAAVAAVVSRGGRPDLAGPALARVRAPTLLVVGGNDLPVIALNEAALAQLPGEKRLVIVPRATHLFEEPGAMEQVADLARQWFVRYLGAPGDPEGRGAAADDAGSGRP